MSITKNQTCLNPKTTILPSKSFNETDTNHASINYHESFKQNFGILDTTNELTNLTLEDGKHHTNNQQQTASLSLDSNQ